MCFTLRLHTSAAPPRVGLTQALEGTPINIATTELDSLAFEFFREFARYEYCLKATGLREKPGAAKANWTKYAAEVTQVIETPEKQDLQDALAYFTNHPPKKQIVKKCGSLGWSETLPNHQSKAELILLLVCRVRNNLFHGGKFNGQWFEPQRSEYLMQHALVILRACGQAHPKVSEAYAGSAP